MALVDENKNFTSNRVSGSDGSQFKATKMWNEILEAFYMGIESKNHKRKLKCYYDCFTASEAISWLKNHLRDCDQLDGSKVTRFQALNLLRKYHEANIIERVIIEKNHKQIQDDNSLIHFTVEAKENFPFMKTSNEGEDGVELSLGDKLSVYKEVTWNHLVASFGDISNYVKLDTIDALSLYNNINKVNSNGVVQLTDRVQDLPEWILSAMKCLANWPRASGSGNCLPKYPGFEFDVFTIIKDYFNNIEEPLLPYSFYQIVILIFNKYNNIQHIKQETFTMDKPKQRENLLNLPANCVYETVFSGREPVTKIVPLDEFSGAFPDFLEYFHTTKPLSKTNTSLLSPPFNTSINTFQAVSTLDRRHLRSKTPTATTLTPQLNKPEPYTFNLISPPESSEYMEAKSCGSRRFHSLGRNFKQRKTTLASAESPKSTEESKEKLYECLRVLLLLLPSRNRRHLQLLMRMIYKVEHNDQLEKRDILSKQSIIDAFTRSIIRPHAEIDYDEIQAKLFVSFLLEECMHIFTPKETLIAEINEALKKQQENKSKLVYCSQVKSEEFEMQRDVFSEQALSELLESIMKSDSMCERDKLKWIKQFKVYHPEVYDVYSNNCALQPNSTITMQKEQEKRTRSRSLSFLADKNLVKRFISLKF